MTGWLKIVGLGAGAEKWLTPEASDILHTATDIIGYTPYVDAVPKTVSAKLHASDNGVEVARAEYALSLAAGGAKVAVVSGGDAGVFGMAAAVFEAIENGDTCWRELDIEVTPAVTALLAASARIGAPLGHDFCVISLSTYLKSWEIIEKRLRASADGDFVLAIYNPTSKHRAEDLQNALKIMRETRDGETIAIIATKIGREGEEIIITNLSEIKPEQINMLSLLIIGSSHTKTLARAEKPPFVYTPRFYTPK
jgi:precorrin-3B C17-methyltransferase